jgi:hypothetical protein
MTEPNRATGKAAIALVEAVPVGDADFPSVKVFMVFLF